MTDPDLNHLSSPRYKEILPEQLPPPPLPISNTGVKNCINVVNIC